MKNKLLFSILIVSLNLFLANTISAQASEYPQITEQKCDAVNPCSGGLECFSFPSIGLRCAQFDPCSYFKCPGGTTCIIAESYPARVMCSCIGPQCLATSGDEDTVGYDISDQTVVHTVSIDNQATSQKKITLWKTSPPTMGGGEPPGEPIRGLHEEPRSTDEDRGILETPVTSVEYRSKLFIRKSRLFMDTPAGEKPVNLLPEDAIGKARGVEEILEIKKVELRAEAEKPIYSVKGVRHAKLFALIPVTLEIETKVSAETGEVISVNKPVWSFLVW